MIGKDQQTWPLTAGYLPAPNSKAKGHIPDAIDAGHFGQLAKAGAGKPSEIEKPVAENFASDLPDQTQANNFDANSNSNALHLILMPFGFETFAKVSTAENTETLVDGQIKDVAETALNMEVVTDSASPIATESFPANDGFSGAQVALPVAKFSPMPMAGVHEISPIRQSVVTKAEPQNVQLNADPNTGLKHSAVQRRMVENPTQVGFKPSFEGPAGLPAKALVDMAQLVQMPIVQTPVATSQLVTRLNSLPAVTYIQIEQIKRNSAGVLTSLELVLEPAELGRITARLQHEDGQVTLVLNAANSHVADDLARDSGLLLRVLGEHIQNVDQMTVHIETDTHKFMPARGQTPSDFGTAHQGQKGQSQQTPGRRSDLSDVMDRVVLDTHPATPSRIFV